MGNGRSLQPSDFEGAALEQMRNWVHGGSGAEGLHSTADGWKAEEKYMRELSERVKARMSQAGAVIQGQSGEAMQNAVSPVALWTEVSADNAQAQGQRLQSQGDAFAKVQSSIPAKGEEQHPPEDNFLEQGWASLTGGKTDNEVATAHNEQLRQEAVTAFQGYDNTSQTNVSSSAVFTAPPQAGQPPAVAPAGGAEAAGGPGSGAHHASAAHGGVSGSGAGVTGAHHAGVAHSNSSAAAGSPSGTNAAGAHAAAPQPWQQGTLESPGGNTAGGSGVAGGVLGGGGALAGGAGAARGGASTGGGSASGGSSGSGGARGAASGSGRGSLGPGGSAGSGTGSGEPEGGSSANGRKGANSAAGGGAPGMGAGRGGDDDDEHYSPEFLKGDHGFFDDELPKVAPPVLGQEREPDQY